MYLNLTLLARAKDTVGKVTAAELSGETIDRRTQRQKGGAARKRLSESPSEVEYEINEQQPPNYVNEQYTS
jgi:hypothetical protein